MASDAFHVLSSFELPYDHGDGYKTSEWSCTGLVSSSAARSQAQNRVLRLVISDSGVAFLHFVQPTLNELHPCGCKCSYGMLPARHSLSCRECVGAVKSIFWMTSQDMLVELDVSEDESTLVLLSSPASNLHEVGSWREERLFFLRSLI